jgi:ABC-type cobalamin/Fe3+-siderophores transport system ATPase subunit
MIRTLASLREKTGLTVVMITHDLQLTGVFDKVVALRCGKVAANGKPGEVLCDHKLCEIYDDPNVRSRCMGKQHVVWVDL